MFTSDDTTGMSGSQSDIERARRFKRPGEQLLWFRYGSREYVLRDPAILREVEGIWRQVEGVGKLQWEIGVKQSTLGQKQAELGARQAQIAEQQAQIAASRAYLEALQIELKPAEAKSAERAKALEKFYQEIKLKLQQAEVEKLTTLELLQQLNALADQLEQLQPHMDALSRQMDEALLKAQIEMRMLLDRAIKSGAAEVVK
jgi:hypothetical protein